MGAAFQRSNRCVQEKSSHRGGVHTISADVKLLYIFCYDITDNKTRTKLDKVLSGYGIRVQYSVYECFLSKETCVELTQKINVTLGKYKFEPQTDSIRIYRNCESCRKNIEIIGAGPVSDHRFIVV